MFRNLGGREDHSCIHRYTRWDQECHKKWQGCVHKESSTCKDNPPERPAKPFRFFVTFVLKIYLHNDRCKIEIAKNFDNKNFLEEFQLELHKFGSLPENIDIFQNLYFKILDK